MIAAEINQILSQLNASATVSEEDHKMSDCDIGKKLRIYYKFCFPTCMKGKH